MRFITGLLLAISAAAYLFIGYGLTRSQFPLYLAAYLVLFAAYIHLVKKNMLPALHDGAGWSASHAGLLLHGKSDLQALIGAAIIFRVLFLFSMPVLSDDYFRFAWDGTMITSGVNPYTVIPAEYMKDCDKHLYYLIDLFKAMNSPGYYTVYPPVCQFLFGWSAQWFPDDLAGTVIMLRFFCIAAETGTILLILNLLKQLNLPRRNVLIYALNPLVIIELSGNIHFEAIMIFFLVLAVHLMIVAGKGIQGYTENTGWPSQESLGLGFPGETEKKPTWKSNAFNRHFAFSAISFAMSVSTKLIPLLFLPFLIRRLKWKNSLLYFCLVGISFTMLFLPFLNQQLLAQWGSSLQLYFRHFEFNAGIYYLVRWAGFQLAGHNIIEQAGIGLAAVTVCAVLLLAIREKDPSWKKYFEVMQWSLAIYLLLATTVHPWYITTLVMCSVFTGYRFALIWSLFIALSYSTYQAIPYQENLWLVAVEYAAVAGTIWYDLRFAIRKKQGG